MADNRNLDFLKKEQCFSIATLACYITSLPKAIYEKSNVIFFVLPPTCGKVKVYQYLNNHLLIYTWVFSS